MKHNINNSCINYINQIQPVTQSSSNHVQPSIQWKVTEPSFKMPSFQGRSVQRLRSTDRHLLAACEPIIYYCVFGSCDLSSITKQERDEKLYVFIDALLHRKQNAGVQTLFQSTSSDTIHL